MTGAVAACAALAVSASAQAATAVPLGTADSFAVLAGSSISNAGASTITGDIGVCCTGVAMTGFGPGANQVTQPQGALYAGPGTPAASAQDDLDVAYFNAAGQPVTRTVDPNLSLSGTPATPLKPGVYESTAHGALSISTGLTLDFQGNPNAVFIFQGTALTTAAGAAGSINVVNAGGAPSGCNVFWQLSSAGTAVTLGAASAFVGTTMSLGASTLGTGATVQGRILTRRDKAVTLLSNTITRTACAAALPAVPGFPGPAAGAPIAAAPAAPTPAAAAPAPAPAVATPAPADTTPAPANTTPAPADAPEASAPTAPAAAPAAPVAPTRIGTARLTPVTAASRARCRTGFLATVRGTMIKRVVFHIDGRLIATRDGPLFRVYVRPAVARSHRTLRARVTFTDATVARTLTFGYRACAPAILRPARGPSQFTG